MASKKEVVERGFKFIAGLLPGGGRRASTAVSPAVPRFNVADLPGMRGVAGPSSAFPRVSPGFRQRVNTLAGGFLGSPLIKESGALRKGAVIAGGIGGLVGGAAAIGAGRSILDYLRGGQQPSGQPQFSTAGGPSWVQQQLSQPTQADILRELYASPAFTQQVSAPGYAAAVAATNEANRKSLEDYLTTVEGMGRETARSIADAYAELGKGTAALGEQQQIRGQEVAADIDRLYQQLGLAEAELAAGGGLAGAPTDVSGLVPVGGEMATAQQVTPTYGASLADYLGREATIGGQALAQQALSQAEQGAGTAVGLQNMIALAGAQQRFAADQAAADRLSQAQMADLDFARQMEAQRIAMGQEQARELALAQLADDARRTELLGIVEDAVSEGKFIWDSATGAAKSNLEAAFGTGPAGRINFIAALRENPTILRYFTGE